MIKESITDWDKFKSFPKIPNCTKWEHFRKYTLYEAKKRNKAFGVDDISAMKAEKSKAKESAINLKNEPVDDTDKKGSYSKPKSHAMKTR